MSQKVIALTVGTASIPIYEDDVPAVMKILEAAIEGRSGQAHVAHGDKERVQAVRFTVADTSRLTASEEHGV